MPLGRQKKKLYCVKKSEKILIIKLSCGLGPTTVCCVYTETWENTRNNIVFFILVQSEPPMLSEHFTGEHGHPAVVPYYLHGGRPDVPLFVPRAGPIPGPPPLLGSKREGGDPHSVSPFFQGAFPPPVCLVLLYYWCWFVRSLNSAILQINP